MVAGIAACHPYGLPVPSRPDAVSWAFVDVLRDCVEEAGIGQVELARRAGLSQSQVSRLLRHEVALSFRTAVALCDVLEVPLPVVFSAAEGRARI